MSRSTDWELDDYLRIRAVIASLSPAEVQAEVGANWLGFYEPGETLADPPASASDPSAPRCWARWAILVEEVEATLDADAPVHRTGAVMFEVRYQAGAAMVAPLKILRAVRRLFAEADVAGLQFEPQEASYPMEPLGEYLVQGFSVRYHGGD